MAGHPHEETLQVFTRRPEFLRRILNLPPDAKLVREDPVVKEPHDHIADGVRVLVDDKGARKLAIIIESQMSRAEAKAARWNHYSTGVRMRLGCPVLVLVVTLTSALQGWARAQIREELCNGHAFPHKVLGPEIFPRHVKPEDALKDPELTILSAMGHICRERSREDPLDVMLTLARLMTQDNYKAACERLLKTGFSGEELESLEAYMIANPSPDYNAFYEYFRLTRPEQFEEAWNKGEAQGLERGQKIGLERGQKIGLERGQEIGQQLGREIGRTARAIARAAARRGWSLSDAQEDALMEQELEILKRRLAYVPQAESVEELLADDI